jgi:hypothetical protein
LNVFISVSSVKNIKDFLLLDRGVLLVINSLCEKKAISPRLIAVHPFVVGALFSVNEMKRTTLRGWYKSAGGRAGPGRFVLLTSALR